MEAIGRNTMQMSINSDTTAITITSDLTRLFSLIAKEQASLMDYGGVMNSILPVWTVRFATITQSSSSSLAVDSIVWNCSSSRSGFTNCDASWLAIIVKERDRVILIPLNRFSCCKECVWDDMLLDDCFRVVNYPNCRVFSLGCSFPRVEQSTVSPIDSDGRMVLLWNSIVFIRW